MPILDIGNPLAHARTLSQDAPLRLFALTSFPDDAQHRERYLAEIDKQGQNLAEKGIDTIEELAQHAARLAFEIRARDPRLRPPPISVKNAVYRVSVAGSLLLLALNSPPEKRLGIKGARRQLEQILHNNAESLRTANLDHPVPAASESIKRAWRSHHAVAHLCAAFALWGAWAEHPGFPLFEIPGTTSSHRNQFDPRHVETLPAFLGAAEALRIAGESHYPAIGKGGAVTGERPLLDPLKTFRCPPGFFVPQVIVGKHLVLPAGY